MSSELSLDSYELREQNEEDKSPYLLPLHLKAVKVGSALLLLQIEYQRLYMLT